MALSPGSRFGGFEIISIIGRGGMGEVYRARDPRLARDVALKVLPHTDAPDQESRARLEREGRVLASLSHPHIAAVYGLEESASASADVSSSTAAIVMELVDGETLAERLQRGPLPLAEALRVAGQIAGALEAAHLKGIVHRDLKPANVKMTPGGTVKVLDFGLAKFLAEPSHDAVTLSAVTARGVVLGTPAYMAPEQAQGKAADRRVDVWAFGVVLYEMVTGERPFRGESVQDTFAAVLTADPDWDRVPAALRPLLRACLARDPRERLRDIGDYPFLLQPADATLPPRRSRLRSGAIVAASVAATTLAFFAGSLVGNRDGSAPPRPIRLSPLLPAGVSVTRGPGYTSSVAVSPDGRTVVIAASDKDGQRLYRRSLDRLEPTPLAGSERGSSPFFSWDGNWIGFFADGRLRRIPVQGGASVDIADAPGFPSGASWGPDNRVVFAYGADSNLHIVSSDGGTVEPLIDKTPGRQPEVLPNGRTVLFESAGHIHAYDRQAGTLTRLLPGTAPRFANGHVIFSRGTTLLAAPLDVDSLSVSTPVPLVQGVAVELPGSGGGRHYAISRSGTLAYVPAAEAYELVVAGANAAERIIGQPQRSFENPRFSPDGRYLVVAARRRDDEAADLWLHDLQAGSSTRLTSNGGRAPIWRDEATIIYSHLGERQGIYATRVDGAGVPSQLLGLTGFHWLVGWTRARATLLYGLMNEGRSSIMAYDGTNSRTVVGPGNTWGGRLSRDGRWLAYYLLRSGTFEVYVTRFPEGGEAWLVAEGTDPSWGPDNTEIYYRSGPRLIAARVDTAANVKVSSTRVVIDPFLPPLYDDYDIHPDGRTMVAVRPVNRTQGREVTIVLDWFSEFNGSDR